MSFLFFFHPTQKSYIPQRPPRGPAGGGSTHVKSFPVSHVELALLQVFHHTAMTASPEHRRINANDNK